MKIKNFLCFSFIFVLSGCAHIEVLVDSISDGSPANGSKCFILPSSKETSPDDLQFREYASCVAKALVFKGYTVTEDKSDANLIVFLDYGMGEPEERTATYTEPVYGKTGVSSSTTTSEGYGNYYTTYQPSYGVVGSETKSYTYDIFTRYIGIQAYKVKSKRNKEKPKQLWKTTIVSSGPNGDLRFVFPIMIGASMEYIGENTGQAITKTSYLDDKDVLYIRGEN